MKEEIDKVSAREQSKAVADENTKVLDLGSENFPVGLIQWAFARNPRPRLPAEIRPPRGPASGVLRTPDGSTFLWA